MAPLSTTARSADAAVLLVSSYSAPGVCGVNYFNTVTSGNTIGTVRKGCALGYYSFAHEVSVFWSAACKVEHSKNLQFFNDAFPCPR